jgi:hypothetical protein
LSFDGGEKGGAAAYVFWGVCLCTCHDEEHHEKVAPTEKKNGMSFFSSLPFRNHLSGTETNPVSSLVFDDPFATHHFLEYCVYYTSFSDIDTAEYRMRLKEDPPPPPLLFDSIPKLTPTRVEIVQQQGKVTIITRPELSQTLFAVAR